MIRAMSGLADNFHVIVKDQELKNREDQMDPKLLASMIRGKSSEEAPIDNQLFVLLLKNYFYSHSKLKVNLDQGSDRFLQKALHFLNKNDSHLVLPQGQSLDDSHSLKNIAEEMENLHPSSDCGGSPTLVDLGDDFLDDDRKTVQSLQFPTYNVNPRLTCSIDLELAIIWVQVGQSYQNKLRAVRLKTSALMESLSSQLDEIGFEVNYYRTFGPR